MSATIIKFPQRPRGGWRSLDGHLSRDPKVRKAVALLTNVSLALTKLAIERIQEFERTHPPVKPPAA